MGVVSGESVCVGTGVNVSTEDKYTSFHNFLLENGIRKVDSFEEQEEVEGNCYLDVELQLSAISDFHKKTMGYTGSIGKRFENNLGKLVEDYKVNNRRLKRDLKKLEGEKELTDFQELLLQYGDIYLRKAEKCIEIIYDSGYLDILRRSMDRSEICLGNVEINNIRKNKNVIEIIDTSKCEYNVVELDLINFINTIGKHDRSIDYSRMVNKFCEYEGLDLKSRRFILALISYPENFMKCCNKYREGKKAWSDMEYYEKLIKAMKKDSISFV